MSDTNRRKKYDSYIYPKNGEKHFPGHVEGKGFKDKETALKTLENFKGRDPLFQNRSINLLKQSCRTALRKVQDPQKKKNLEEAMEVFDKWLENYQNTKMGKQTNFYIPLQTLEGFIPLLKHYDITNEFLDVYVNECNGDYKRLRQIKGENNETTWDIVRNTAIKELKAQSEENEERLWTEDMIPSKIHAKMISWAYSPHKEIRLKPQHALFEKINNIISK